MRPSIFKIDSSLALNVTRLFVVLFVFDAANVNDLIPGVVVDHPDANQSVVGGTVIGYSARHGGMDILLVAPYIPKDVQPVKILIDVDSPSLAASTTSSLRAPNGRPKGLSLGGGTWRPVLPLYLFHHSLLI